MKKSGRDGDVGRRVYIGDFYGGVTYKRDFDLPRIRQASDERVVLLQSELENERRQRQEKDKVSQDLMNQLAAQKGQTLQSTSTPSTPTEVRHFLC